MLDVMVGVGGQWWETGTERSEWGGKMLGEVRMCANSFGERNCLCKCSSALICFINLKWEPFNPNLLPVAKRTVPGLFCTLCGQACDAAVLLCAPDTE